jgi:F-box protein 11
VISGDPYILNNLIEKNYGNGITTNIYDNLRCDGKIRNNEILGNLENGVECIGNSNFSRVFYYFY